MAKTKPNGAPGETSLSFQLQHKLHGVWLTTWYHFKGKYFARRTLIVKAMTYQLHWGQVNMAIYSLSKWTKQGNISVINYKVCLKSISDVLNTWWNTISYYHDHFQVKYFKSEK